MSHQAYTYNSLQQSQIRLLTLQPHNDKDNSAPICCSLESVSLSSLRSRPNSTNYKGADRLWPEASSEQQNTETIFKKKLKTSFAHIPELPPTITYDWVKDEQLPWAFNCGDYIALSYEWGQDSPAQSILLDGYPFLVGPNLFEALLQLRKCCRVHQGFKLWIDAICINQKDDRERSQQVALMRQIYASAWHVLVWLGPEANDSSIAFSALSWISRFSQAYPSLDTFYRKKQVIDLPPLINSWPFYKSPLRKEVNFALFRLLTRKYWQRMWILQEVATARSDAPVMCGAACLTWDVIHSAMRHIARDESRLGRDIAHCFRPGIISKSYAYEFGRSRLPEERAISSERLWQLLVDISRVQQNQQNPSTSSHALDNLRPLLLSREAEASDNKDRVYGVTSFSEVTSKATIKPDYSLSLQEIYIDFTSQIIKNGDLNLLRLSSASCGPVHYHRNLEDISTRLKPSIATDYIVHTINYVKPSTKTVNVSTECLHNLPTWTICWICKPVPTAHLTGPYNAGGPGSPVSISSGPNPVLSVSGFVFDTIASLSAFHTGEKGGRFPMNYSDTNNNIYGDLEATRTAFWRTLVADTTPQGDKHAPEAWSWLLDPRIWADQVSGVYTYGFAPDDVMYQNQDLRLCGYTFRDLIFGKRRAYKMNGMPILVRHNFLEDWQYEPLGWAINVKAMRRLIGTSAGRMGLAPAGSEGADRIAILHGCSTPMVLRPFSNGFKIIGECYVHGVMYGEIVGSQPTELITIY